MRRVIGTYQHARGLPAFGLVAASALIGLLFSSCSGSEDETTNENQAGNTDPTAGESNGTAGAKPISAVGENGGLRIDTGQSSGGTGGEQISAGAGGAMVSADAGGRQADGGNNINPTAGTGGTEAAGGSDANPTAGTGGEPEDTGDPDVPCNPADTTAPPTSVPWTDTDTPPTGPYEVFVEWEPGLPTHTIYRPQINDEFKMPIIAWGEGGCLNHGMIMVQFLYNVASHGFLIVADGIPNPTTIAPQGASGEALINAIDWAIAENERPCSQYYHKLDTTKISVSGQSCGGLMAYYAAADPRVTTVVIWNSGLFAEDQRVYDSLHAPMAYFNGGPSDIAYANGERDWNAISPNATFPIFYSNNTLGHGGTYNIDNGGECARVGEAWWRWQLMGDEGPTGKEMFWGPNCGLCNDPAWTVERVNMGE